MKGKRNIDKVTRGRRKPMMMKHDFSKVWHVSALETAGAKVEADPFFHEDQALRHAAWWHTHPGLVEVTITGPAYEGIKHIPTEADVQVGEAMVELLEHTKVCPATKYLIGKWMDSKAWGGTLDG